MSKTKQVNNALKYIMFGTILAVVSPKISRITSDQVDFNSGISWIDGQMGRSNGKTNDSLISSNHVKHNN